MTAAAGRVSAVHRQTRRSLLVVVAFLAAAAATAVLDGDQGRWAALHLFTVGALLTAVSTATVYLAVTWSAAPAPTDRAAAWPVALLALGATGLAVTRRAGAPGWTTGATSVLVVTALALVAAQLVSIRRHAAKDRFHPAIDGYLVALVIGIVGSIVGGLLAAGSTGDHAVAARDAHLGANLFGLVGLVIAATLPYMVATQARTKMSPKATPEAIWAVFSVLVAANTVLFTGRLVEDDRLSGAGLAVYALTLLALVRILPRVRRRQLEWAGPRLIQLGSGILWWILATAVLAWETGWGDGRDVPALLALVIGGYAQILTASLAYLGPVVRGGGHVRLSAGFALTRSWVAPIAGNTAAVAALAELDQLLAGALAVWALDLVVRSTLLVSRAGSSELASADEAPPAGHPGGGS